MYVRWRDKGGSLHRACHLFMELGIVNIKDELRAAACESEYGCDNSVWGQGGWRLGAGWATSTSVEHIAKKLIVGQNVCAMLIVGVKMKLIGVWRLGREDSKQSIRTESLSAVKNLQLCLSLGAWWGRRTVKLRMSGVERKCKKEKC